MDHRDCTQTSKLGELAGSEFGNTYIHTNVIRDCLRGVSVVLRWFLGCKQTRDQPTLSTLHVFSFLKEIDESVEAIDLYSAGPKQECLEERADSAHGSNGCCLPDRTWPSLSETF